MNNPQLVACLKAIFHRNFGDSSMTRADRITREIRRHDRLLYCEKSPQGPLAIYRKLYRYEPMEVNGVIIHYPILSPHLVFAITDTWSITGRPVEWGILPIMARIKAMDLWTNDNIVNDLIDGYKKDEESKERDQRNSIESFLLDFRRQFAKSFDQYNTGTLDKRKDRRFKDDIKLKEN